MEMNNRLWHSAEGLAQALATKGIDRNVISTAAAYARAYPDTDFLLWVNHFAQLGEETFGSSNQTDWYRRTLQDACQQLKPAPQNGLEWAMVLGWAARLYAGYATPSRGNQRDDRQPHARQQQSKKRKPPRPGRTSKKAVAYIPEVREEVSDAAQDIFNKLFGGGDKP